MSRSGTEKTDKGDNDILEIDNATDIIKRPRSVWKIKLESMLLSYKWVGAMSLVTFYVLFMEDIRELAIPMSADLTMDILYIIAMSLYFAELVMGSIAIDGYFLRFFFWIDLISLLSMLPDISFILTAIDDADKDVEGAN